MLKATDICFCYNRNSFIKDVSISADPGEFVALVGPNGCGKTTVLKLLSGVLRPQTGSICLEEKDIHTIPVRERARKIAAVEQHIPALPGYTVQSVVEFGRIPHIGRWQQHSLYDQECVQRAMQKTHVESLKLRQIDTLSSGERQRVWLAMALAQNPSVLLLDEPISHLDIQHQVETLRLLQELADSGVAVISSIHELHLVGAFADRVVLMKQGQIIAQGSPQTVLTTSNIAEVFSIQTHIFTDTESGKIWSIAPKL